MSVLPDVCATSDVSLGLAAPAEKRGCNLAVGQLIGFRGFLCLAIAVAGALGGRASSEEPFRILAISGSHLPYENLGDAKAPGFSVEVVRQVFAAMGKDVHIEEFPFYRAYMMLLNGEPDGITRTLRGGVLDRACYFPDEPLTPDKFVFFVRTVDAERLKFSSFDELVGHDVAVQVIPIFNGTAEAAWPQLSKFLREHHNMVETKGTDVSFPLLAAGRVDYAVTSLGLGKGAIVRLGLSGKIEPLSFPMIDKSWYVCFSKAHVSPAFVDAFSHALKQFKQTDAFQSIYSKYFP